MAGSLFLDLEIHEEIKTVLQNANFTEMTEVQVSVIPEFMKKDVIVQSQTGSGKTLAYLIPLLNFLYSRNQNSDKQCLSGLIIVPTRELSIQIDEVFKLFKFQSEIFIGGSKIEEDTEKLKNNISVAIGTPGRLQEIISANSKAFSKVKYVVLDESDKLLSFGFEAKLQRILQFLPKNRITGLFSATINDSVNRLSMSFLKNPISIKVTDHIPEKLNIKYMIVSPKDKIYNLTQLICKRKSIVFFSTCNTTDYFFELFSRIFRYKEGNLQMIEKDTKEDSYATILKDFAIHKIHGKMDQRDRNKIYSEFEKIGGTLFCTDVAARGIDFKGVDLVVHFDFPKDHENIVHRSGRTARNGHSGDSIIFLMPNEKSMVEFLKLKGLNMEMTSLNSIVKRLEDEICNEHSRESKINEFTIDQISTDPCENTTNSDLKHSNDENNTTLHFEIREKMMDKILLNLSVKSFVSYVRGYKEHILNYILNFKELNYDELAEMHFLEKIPSMAELKNVKFKNFEKPEQQIKRRK